MNKRELINELFRYRKNELKMKEYYEQHHKLCTFDFYQNDEDNTVVFYESIPIASWSTDSVNTLSYARKTIDETPFYVLTEKIFDQRNSDVILSKHPRYSPYFLHCHAYFELIYVYEGNCTNTIESNTLSMKTGDLCIIPPNVIHAITVTDDSTVINIMLRTSTFQNVFGMLYQSNNILADFFNQILYSNTFRKYLLFRTGSDNILSELILDMMLQQINAMPYKDYIINGTLITFCGYLLQNHESDVDLPKAYFSKETFIPKVINYIMTNYATVTLQSLADYFYINSRYLSSLIKENTGDSFQVLITKIRMEKAGELLKESDYSISQISDRTGYSDPAYFMKAFKKYYGYTPSEFRKAR